MLLIVASRVKRYQSPWRESGIVEHCSRVETEIGEASISANYDSISLTSFFINQTFIVCDLFCISKHAGHVLLLLEIAGWGQATILDFKIS